jgi:hypothetical protein
MDRRERINNQMVALQAFMQSWQAGVWTALPATVEAFDASAMTVSCQPTIQGKVRDQQGEWSDKTLPLLTDCPVVFPGGGGFLLTFPLAKGDEGLVVFASRCIDGWWQSSGVQPQMELRQHDLSDGLFIPRMFSKPNAPSGVGATAKLRSLDGNTYVELASGNVVSIHASGGINLTGNVTITGTVHATGDVSSDTDVKAGTVSLNSHHHTGVQTGAGVTGGPV